MSAERFANLAQTTLTAEIGAPSAGTSETITVASTALFPSEPQFRLTAGPEIMLATALPGGNKFTVTRGAEGTTPVSHPAGTVITHLLTAGALGGQSDAAAGTPALRSLGTGSQQAAQGSALAAETERAEAAEASAEAVSAAALALEQTARETGDNARLTKTGNLAELLSPGESRQNLHIPDLLPVQCVAVTNVATLAGLQTFDGYTLEPEQLVLLTGQTESKNNGPWLTAGAPGTGGWTRPTDFSTGVAAKARKVAVINGTVYAGSDWLLKTNGSVVVGTSVQTWVRLLTAEQEEGATLHGEGAPSTSLGVAGQFYVQENESKEPISLWGPKHIAVTPNAFPSAAEIGAPPAGYQGTGATELHCELGGAALTSCEVFAILASLSTHNGAHEETGKTGVNEAPCLYLRAKATAGVFTTGYRLKILEGALALYAGATKIGEVTGLKPAVGEGYGLRMIGVHLTIYRKQIGKGWEEVLTVRDATYAEGEIGAGTWSGVEAWEKYGGGVVVSAENPTWGVPVPLNAVQINVAKPTGIAATDNANIKAAIEEAFEHTYAKIAFAPGRYRVTEPMPWYSYHFWEGAGESATIIENETGPVVRSANFAALKGTKKGGGVFHCGLRHMTLVAGESSTEPALLVYGRYYRLENLETLGGTGSGIYSEYNESEEPVGEYEQYFEAYWRNVNVKEYLPASAEGNTFGVFLNGPHDSRMDNVIISSFKTGKGTHKLEAPFAMGLYVKKASGGSNNWMISNLHIYGRHTHSLYVEEVNCNITNGYIEAGSWAAAVISTYTTWLGGFILGNAGEFGAKEVGIQIGDKTSDEYAFTGYKGFATVACQGAQVIGVIFTNYSAKEARAVRWVNSTGGNVIRAVQGVATNAHLYEGTPNEHDFVELFASGEPVGGLFQNPSITAAPGASMTVYVTPGTYKWKKTKLATGFTVTMMSGGGGGAAGNVTAAKTASQGGNGGGGGALFSATGSISLLGSETEVVVGAGGKGGTSPGGKGELGGFSKFAAIGRASAGIGGSAFSTFAGGEAGFGTTNGGNGGQGRNNAAEAGEAGKTSGAAGGGGGGGGITTGEVAEAGGKGGGGAGSNNTGGNAGAATGAEGSGGSSAVIAEIVQGGGGGGGGGANTTGNGGKGGKGGTYGGGGGGGGAALTGHEGGEGGEGGAGLVVIATW